MIKYKNDVNYVDINNYLSAAFSKFFKFNVN